MKIKTASIDVKYLDFDALPIYQNRFLCYLVYFKNCVTFKCVKFCTINIFVHVFVLAGLYS